MPIKITRSSHTRSGVNDISPGNIRVIASFISPVNYANSLLPNPQIVLDNGYVTIPTIYFAVVDNNNVVETNFNQNTLGGGSSKSLSLVSGMKFQPATGSLFSIDSGDTSIRISNGIGYTPPIKMQYTGSGSNTAETHTFNILVDNPVAGSANNIVSTFTITTNL